jgi:hypothetical protein
MSNSEENEGDIDRDLPSQEQVDKYLMLSPMLDALMSEMREFAKKKADTPLNATKVLIINRVLKPLKENVLRDEKSLEYLDLLDEEGLPQNSDVVIILSQFQAALRQFKEKHYYRDGDFGERVWHTKEQAQEERAEEDEDEGEEGGDEYESDDEEVDDDDERS